MTTPTPLEIADRLTETQREWLAAPHLLIIDNWQCVPASDWPAEMIEYQWPYYDALNETGLAVHNIIKGEHNG